MEMASDATCIIDSILSENSSKSMRILSLNKIELRESVLKIFSFLVEGKATRNT